MKKSNSGGILRMDFARNFFIWTRLGACGALKFTQEFGRRGSLQL